MSTIMKQPRKTLPGVVSKSRWLPPKICIYGTPGIGKSTFGAGAPNPIFIPTEAGVENLDVARFPVAETLDDLLAHLRLVAEGDHDHGAVVIDTLNGLMELYYRAKKDIPGDKGRPLYDFIGFGGHSGWSGVARNFKEDVPPLLAKCQARGMYVVLLAHAGQYTRKNPLGDDLEVAAPSVPKQVWKDIHGDMDVIGRADYVYTTRKAGLSGKAKASTDEESVDGVKVKVRQLTFDGGVEQDCKARVGYELPPTLPLSWDAFAAHIGNVRALAQEIRDLWRYLPEDKITATLGWLGVDSLERLAEANRSKLSQLRNRLVEEKAATPPEEPDAIAAVVTDVPPERNAGAQAVFEEEAKPVFAEPPPGYQFIP